MGQASLFSVSIECCIEYCEVNHIDGTSLSMTAGTDYIVKLWNKTVSYCDATLMLDEKVIGTWFVPPKQHAAVQSRGSESYYPLSSEKGTHKLEVRFEPRAEMIEPRTYKIDMYMV